MVEAYSDSGTAKEQLQPQAARLRSAANVGTIRPGQLASRTTFSAMLPSTTLGKHVDFDLALSRKTERVHCCISFEMATAPRDFAQRNSDHRLKAANSE